MGLGKTVQMISLILANPSDRTTIRSKTTLIVCPVGLLRQWKVEVEEKTKKHLRVLVHHGPKRKNGLSFRSSAVDKVRHLADVDALRQRLESCTNTTLWSRITRRSFRITKKEAHSSIRLDGFIEVISAHSGSEEARTESISVSLVILDEAHTIKNPSAQKSLACTDLKAEYRWALTGTPLVVSFESFLWLLPLTIL